MVSGNSPATGLKSGQSNRERNFGNVVSYESHLRSQASSLIFQYGLVSYPVLAVLNTETLTPDT